ILHSSFCIPHWRNYAKSKTWKQAPREAQKDFSLSKRLSWNEIKAVPLGQGVGRARTELCLYRPKTEKARLSQALDRPHQRGVPPERHQVLAVRSRPHACGHRA